MEIKQVGEVVGNGEFTYPFGSIIVIFWQVYGAQGVCVPICSGFISFTVLQFPGKKQT